MASTHETASPRQPNSQAAVQTRADAGLIHWAGPLMLLFARPVLMIVSQALTALIFLALHRPSPWRTSGFYWTVYGTLVDIGCIAGMLWFTRCEGIRLRDLLGPVRLRHGRDVFLGLAYFLLVFPLFLAAGTLAHKLLYAPGVADPGAYLAQPHPMPLWSLVYTFAVWWLIWSATEEATYQAYVMPRLRALSGRTWLTFLVVGFIWAFQHTLLPLVPDWRYIAFRTLAFAPGVLGLMWIYWRSRRLAPLVVAHWPMDIAGAFMCNLLPNL